MPKVRELPADLIREWATKHAAANAKLEGRELPEGYIRSEQVQRFLETRKPPPQIQMETVWG